MTNCTFTLLFYILKHFTIAVLFHLSINAGIVLLFFPELNADFKKVHLLSGIGIFIVTVILILKNKVNKRPTPSGIKFSDRMM